MEIFVQSVVWIIQRMTAITRPGMIIATMKKTRKKGKTVKIVTIIAILSAVVSIVELMPSVTIESEEYLSYYE